MYYSDNFDPTAENDLDKLIVNDEDLRVLEKTKRIDKGYNQITRYYVNFEGKTKIKKIDVYASSGQGNFIRDAESGSYYNYHVGSSDEDLFFKVTLATGELSGSNTLFYASPQHYMKHLMCELSLDTIIKWETKRNAKLIAINNTPKKQSEFVMVN
jgi:hypothetical protein